MGVGGWVLRAGFLAFLGGLVGCVGARGGGEGGVTCTPAPHIEGSPRGVAEVGQTYAAVFSGVYNCGIFTCFSLEPVKLPPGASIDNSVKAVFWTPTEDQAGKTFTLSVRTPQDSCGNSVSFTWTVSVVPGPVILDFTAEPTVVNPGETSRLTATYRNGNGWIENLGPVSSGVPVTTPPLTVGTGFTLHVTSALGTDLTRTLVVSVAQPPEILAFTVSRDLITRGETVSLSWATYSTSALRMDPGGLDVTGATRLDVAPTSDTTYTLTAFNITGRSVEARVSVRVVAPPEILSFNVTPETTTLFGHVTLLGTFTGGSGYVDPFGALLSGVPTDSGPLRRSTLFQLMVRNEAGFLVSANVPVAVTGPGTFQCLPEGLPVERSGATATRLADGRVLIAGGSGTTTYGLASTVWFDPGSGAFTAGPSLQVARCYHAAVPVAGNRILLVGGLDGIPLASAELLDPIAGTSLRMPDLPSAPFRLRDLAAALPGGDALVAWGTVAYRFETVSSTWREVGPKPGYTAHTVPLADGRVFFLDEAGPCAVFDPATDTFTTTGTLLHPPLAQATVVPFPDGRVLVASGLSSQLWDPGTGIFQEAGAPVIWVADTLGTLLADGTVLFTGGYQGGALAGCQVFDPATATFRQVGDLLAPRWGHVAPRLEDGRVLVLGGSDSPNWDTQRSAEVYIP